MDIVELLNSKNLTLGSIESLTGGLFASTITSISGASKVYKGSIISYATEIKDKVVRVDKDVISTHGVISSECAYEMVDKGHQILDVDVCISFTGNAGPDTMENKPQGLVYIGIYYLGKIEVREFNLAGDRGQIREKCVKEAINLIKEKLI